MARQGLGGTPSRTHTDTRVGHPEVLVRERNPPSVTREWVSWRWRRGWKAGSSLTEGPPRTRQKRLSLLSGQWEPVKKLSADAERHPGNPRWLPIAH